MSPNIIIVHIIYFLVFGIIGLHLSQFKNRVLLKLVLGRREGREQCCTITLLHMNRLNKTESAIFVSLMCSLLPKNLHSELILSSLQLVLCRVAAVKRLPVHHHSADHISSGLLGSLGSF